MKTTTTLPTIDQLRSMPLAEVLDIDGKKRPRIGSTKAVRYKIADCDNDVCSRVLVIDRQGGEGAKCGSRSIIRSCDPQWDQFIARGC